MDTNAVLEAIDVGCWKAITGGLRIETVEECVRECRVGDHYAGPILVNQAHIDRLSKIHDVSKKQRLELSVVCPQSEWVDLGERNLFAHILTNEPSSWLVCSPDRAAVKMAVHLKWRDRLVSLEFLLARVGARPSRALHKNYTTAWLSSYAAQAVLELGAY